MLHKHLQVPTALLLALALTACVSDDDGDSDSNDDSAMEESDDTEGDDTEDGETEEGETEGQDPDMPMETIAWPEISALFVERGCPQCHGVIPETYDTVVSQWIEGRNGNVLQGRMESEHNVTADQAEIVLAWLEAGYPEE